MGCIVNGQGEMADDFGMSAARPGSEFVCGEDAGEIQHSRSEAVDRLKASYREHGKWVDPFHLHPKFVGELNLTERLPVSNTLLAINE